MIKRPAEDEPNLSNKKILNNQEIVLSEEILNFEDERITEKICGHKFFKPSEQNFKDQLPVVALSMIEQGDWGDLYINRYYWLLLHRLEDLKLVCRYKRIPVSGTKPAVAGRILQSIAEPWEEVTNPLPTNIRFTGNLEAGPTAEMVESLGSRFTCRDIWNKYFTDGDLIVVCNYTNLKKNILLGSSRPNWYKRPLWPPSYVKRFKPVVLEEYKRWIAVLIGKNCWARGVPVKQLWEKQNAHIYSNITKIMSRDRFKAICSLMTIYNPTDDRINLPGIAPHWKTEEYFSKFRANARKNYSPGLFVSRDEQCIRNNHRTRLRHTRMKKKFIQIGIRMEVISSTDGVILDFMIDIPGTSRNQQTKQLISSLQTKGHVIFMDRLYTSFSLVRSVKTDLQQYVCGTCRSDRGFPLELQESCCKLQAGEYNFRTRAGVIAYCWKDSAHCQLLSSYHNPEPSVVTRRQRGVGVVERPPPKAFSDYNKGMGGNDVGDMLRSRNTTHNRSNERWHAVFYYLIDQAIIATYRIWNKLVPDIQLPMHRVAEQLFYGLSDNNDLLLYSDSISQHVEPYHHLVSKRKSKTKIK